MSSGHESTNTVNSKNKIVLDYILAHGGPGECTYLSVDVLGLKFYGLLDSGANKTFMNAIGWEKMQHLGLQLNSAENIFCKLSNNDSLECLGILSVPIGVEGTVRIIDVYVVPELRHELVLGLNFWKELGIVPDMRRGVWYFSSQPPLTPQVTSVQCETDLNSDQRLRLSKLISSYFDSIGDRLGCTSVVKHKIVTNSPPIKQRYYPVSPFKQKLIDEEVDKMLALGVIEPSKSAWSSPVLLVPKRDGEMRFCVDFRKLNAVSEKDAFPLPYISSILDKLGGARYLSSLDLKSAYWQVELEESSKQYTAFTVPGRGLFQFCRLPFGLHNAPATFQRLIDTILGPDLQPYVFCYLDDVIVVSPNFDKHLEILQKVFDRLNKAGLTLNKDKSKFCRSELRYLGYLVNRSGISVDPQKVEAITKIGTPTTVKEVRRIIGMLSWYRRFIPSFSTLISPFTSLLKKGAKFSWDSKCEDAFRAIKNVLISAPILTCPNFEHEFILQTDASAYGVGAVLYQVYDGREHVICYVSRTLSRQERVYSATERELLAVLFGIEKLRCYLEGAKFSVICDHYSLQWLDNLKNPQGRLGRWALRLQQFDYKIIHRKGRDNIVADTLSRSVPISCDIINLDSEDFSQTRDLWYKNLRRQIVENSLKFPAWRVRDGRIYKHVKLDFPELRFESDFWKLVIPKDKRSEILKSCHSSTVGGHLGVHKTFMKVARLYYWPCMRASIAKFVKHCIVCQRTKPEQKRPSGLCVNNLVPQRCWQVISMDLFGPLPRSKKGNAYIFVVTDIFSKFNRFFAIRKATASKVVELLEDQIILFHGVPEIIRCDNGVQFKGKLFREVTQKYGIQVLYNPNYHPSPNVTERVNRVLKSMLTAFTGDNQRTWDSDLAALNCAINTASHEVTGKTPYFINHGIDMVLHGSEYRMQEDCTSECSDDVSVKSSNRVEALQKLRNFVRERLKEAKEKVQSRYNLRRRDVSFDIGDWVWKRSFALSNAANYYTAKLADKFEGPFKVKRKVGYCVYELVDRKGKSKGNWHTQDLKPYYSEDSDSFTSEV